MLSALGCAPGRRVCSKADEAGGEARGGLVSQVEDEDEAAAPIYILRNQKLQEDVYGYVCCSIIRDVAILVGKAGSLDVRIARLGYSLFLLAFNIGVQVLFVTNLKRFVIRGSVRDIRRDYDTYQTSMYGQCEWSSGFPRGVQGTFQAWKFDTLQPELQERICQVPLSQPTFFALALFVWSLTCFGEVQTAVYAAKRFLQLPTMSSMKQALSRPRDGETGQQRIIMGLTFEVKVLLVVLAILPQLGVSLYLLWLGSRWLVSTPNFEDLVLNAAALEFIFNLKGLIFRTCVSHKNKEDIDSTEILRENDHEVATLCSFVSTGLWGICAAGWVAFYMYSYQTALPDYRWDIHTTCKPWIIARLNDTDVS